jgi:DNA-directed RNA polymerase subunit H (RpoH/RPB5)
MSVRANHHDCYSNKDDVALRITRQSETEDETVVYRQD